MPDNNNPNYRSYVYFLICACLSVIEVFMDNPSPVKNVSDLASPSFSIAPEFFTSLL